MRGDLLRMERAGGGGLGLPASGRSRRNSLRRVDGYVSREAAIRDYSADGAKLEKKRSQRERNGGCWQNEPSSNSNGRRRPRFSRPTRFASKAR